MLLCAQKILFIVYSIRMVIKKRVSICFQLISHFKKSFPASIVLRCLPTPNVFNQITQRVFKQNFIYLFGQCYCSHIDNRTRFHRIDSNPLFILLRNNPFLVSLNYFLYVSFMSQEIDDLHLNVKHSFLSLKLFLNN